MLFDRCILTKKNHEWIGIAEAVQRVKARYRFLAWLMAITAIIEMLRLAVTGFWYFNAVEFVVLVLSLFFAVAFFRRSAKTIRRRETVFKIPQPLPIQNEDGLVTGYKINILLPENGRFSSYPAENFSHVVFGLIDYPCPGRKNVYIDAFALYLAEKNATPHPIVEGCFDKFTCYQLGRKLSAITKIPMIELGKGQPYAHSQKLSSQTPA